MAIVSGKKGKVTFGSGYDNDVMSWTVNLVAAEHDTTSLGLDWKTWIPGVREWSGTFEALLDSASVTANASAYSLGSLHLGGVAASVNFIFEDASNDGEITGSIFITGADLNVSQDGPNTINFTFRGTAGPAVTRAQG